MGNLLEKIKSTVKYVSDNSKYVRINYNKIDEVLDAGGFQNISYWLESNPFGILDMPYRDVINFLLVYHTIGDFCFWGEPKWQIDTDKGILDGSYAIMYLLINRFKINQNFNMSYEDFSDLLKGNVEIPLLKERYDFLVKMNKYLDGISKDFYEEIKHIKNDLELLNYIVENFDYFKDESMYNGEIIYFYKRAQLLVSDVLHIRMLLEGINVDYSNLLGCADYKIPQVMNSLGLIEYTEELDSILLEKKELEENSEMEVEIRANDLVVIDYIYEKLNNKICRMDINDYIWLLGQDKSKIDKNYHRTKTVHY